ncbi:fimbrial biogenesis usher protein [Ewingella americana]|uniref:fimbrial biogenesis usher protein n=1 Tax=Ewingella americana TaxID=41202 RepID=UPI001E36CDD5|nr:fimbrial biogenesis usher protein [Ewingella americana]
MSPYSSNLAKRSHLCLAIAAILCPVMSQAEEKVEFNTNILQSRGLDSALGAYFADAPKFMPGRKRVTLKVNGNDKGSVTARFGKNGELCVDRDFLESAGLRVPSPLAKAASSDNPPEGAVCADYSQFYPSAVVTPLPGQEELDLVVPQEALSTDSGGDALNYQSGGSAAMMNYSLFASKNSYGDTDSRYLQGSLEEGINVGDWLVRSRQILSQNDGQSSTNNLYTYAQHTFVDSKTLMQAGQINISNTLFAGASINGAQLVPENALRDASGSGVTVTGIARTAQARVELRQGGVPVYTTLVPAGPFTLTNVPITQVNTALDVTVTETDGSVNHYIIPASAVQGNQLGGPLGFSVAAGQTRNMSSAYGNPTLVTASDGWQLNSWLNTSAGVMVAQQYDALAAGVDVVPLRKMLVSGVVKASHDQRHDNQGQSTTLGVNYGVNESVSLSASATHYSPGFRELQDSLQEDFVQYSSQYNTSVGWSTPLLGMFSVGYSLAQGTQGSPDSRYVSASWSRTFSYASVSVNWQSQLNQSDNDGRYRNSGDLLYVNVSVPFGSQRVNAYMHKRGDDTTTGLQTSGNLGQDSVYTVSAERQNPGSEDNFNAGLNSNLHYTQMTLGAGTTGSDGRNYSGTLSGGIVAGDGGVSFSPYQVHDTFAVAKIDADVSGVQIATPAGNVWTDHWGRALVPSLPEYHKARLEINTDTLPKNIDVNNGFSSITAGRGSVSKIRFGVVKVRRAMIRVVQKNGQILPKGASVINGDGDYITTVVEDGLVFVNDADKQPRLFVLDENGAKQCEIIYQMNEKRDDNAFFEDVTGVCK